MSKPVVEVHIRAIAATSDGFAVFLGNQEKAFVIFVDQSVGAAIAMFMQGTKKERPLTHDLVANILRALGSKTEPIEVVSGSRRQSMVTSKRRRISRETDWRTFCGLQSYLKVLVPRMASSPHLQLLSDCFMSNPQNFGTGRKTQPMIRAGPAA